MRKKMNNPSTQKKVAKPAPGAKKMNVKPPSKKMY